MSGPVAPVRGVTMMRSLIAVVLTVAVTAPVRSQDAARAIIEKAVQAHGGAALDKYPAGRSKSKGSVVIQGTEFPFTSELTYQMPGKARSTFEVVTMNIRRTVTYVANGDKVAAFAGGLAQEMPPSQAEELRTAVYVQNLTRLTPLVNDKRYRLAPAGEKTIEGHATVGVTVSADGHKDVRLYFDPTTQLLAALERPGFDALGKPAEHAETYSGYREANGLKYPAKTLVKQNGKRYLESETVEFKPLPKADPKEFQLTP
jgi:hypothetical protein